jgi:hypothetical protein
MHINLQILAILCIVLKREHHFECIWSGVVYTGSQKLLVTVSMMSQSIISSKGSKYTIKQSHDKIDSSTGPIQLTDAEIISFFTSAT